MGILHFFIQNDSLWHPPIPLRPYLCCSSWYRSGTTNWKGIVEEEILVSPFLFLTKTDQMLKSDPSPILTTTTNLIMCTQPTICKRFCFYQEIN